MTLLSGASLADLVGLTGVAIYLAGYFSLQLGGISARGWAYPSSVIAAATCVLIGLHSNFNLASAVIQVSYISISIFGIAHRYMHTRLSRFSAEEEAFLSEKLPGLNRPSARKVLRASRWRSLAKGTRLTRSGEVAPYVAYIASGSVQSRLGDQVIQTYPAGSLVGEISCLSRSPAVSTCVIETPARCLLIPSDSLRRLAERDTAIREALERCFAHETRIKMLGSYEQIERDARNRVGLPHSGQLEDALPAPIKATHPSHSQLYCA